MLLICMLLITNNNLYCLCISDSFRIVVDNSTMLEMFRNYHDGEVDGVVFYAKQFMTHFNVMNFPHRQLSFSKYQLTNSYHVLYFPKKSVLKNLFNQRIRKLLQSGLTEFWYTQFIPNPLKKPNEDGKSSLYFENIIGVIQICAPMYLISFIVLLLEIMSVTSVRLKYALDYLNY